MPVVQTAIDPLPRARFERVNYLFKRAIHFWVRTTPVSVILVPETSLI
jgi:hypothetical protein